jgi:hypothetical protein
MAVGLSEPSQLIAPTPEPSTIVLAALGMVALLAGKKWRIMRTS